jgi:hypothetical protein
VTTAVPADLTPGESVGIGGSLLLDGYPFHAHEVFEDAWKAAAGPERDLWRGLAQVAVGLTHARRGNARGAAALLARGASRLRDYEGRAGASGAGASGALRPYGIDVAFVATRAGELAGRIERDGLAALPPQALLLGLTELLVTALGGDRGGGAGPHPRVGLHLGAGEGEAGLR